MSITHVSIDICGRSATPAVMHRSIEVITRLIGSAGDLAKRRVVAVLYRVDMRRVARFSDYRLHDIGFERDWDGTVLPRQR